MGDWDEAVVVGVKPGGLYVLDYTDEGLIEEDVPASRIMRQGGAGAADVAEALAAAPAGDPKSRWLLAQKPHRG